MRRQLGSVLLATGLFIGCGNTDSTSPAEPLQTQQAPLTQTDIDVAPECQGIITFANTASSTTLRSFLPINVVDNIIAARTAAPFVTLANLASVSQVGESRLKQIESAARANGLIGPSCIGIMDQLAISSDDQAAIVALVNSVSSTELHDILPYGWNGGQNLLNTRPFTTALAISNTSGISTVSFRNIRNAATLSKPLETLITAVNALPQPDYGVKMARHFDWWNMMVGNGSYGFGVQECFGYSEDDLPYEARNAPIRNAPAFGPEIRAEVEASLLQADRNGTRLSPTVVEDGLDNLDQLTAGKAFSGCYFSYANDPWSGNNVAFYVEQVSGFSIMTRSYWSE